MSSPGLDIALDKTTFESELLETTSVKVTLTPNHGFTGAVTLALAKLPTNVTATFTPATPSISGNTPVDVTLKLSSKAPTTAPVTLDVTATAGTVTASAQLSMAVKRVLTIAIPRNANTVTSPFGPQEVIVAGGISSTNPIKLYFRNDDTVSRTIHADSTYASKGFFHGNAIPPGGTDAVRNLNSAATYNWYLHNLDPVKTAGSLKVQ